MSWSISLMGRTSKVVEALKAQADTMNGQSKIEYEGALPHLVGLVEQNFDPEGLEEPIVKIQANGHGSAQDNVQTQRYCVASIERFYGNLLL